MTGRVAPMTGAELVEELLRLEGAKNRALVSFDAGTFDESTRAQLRLLEENPDIVIGPDIRPERLNSLSNLIRLNTSLVLNLHSISPWIVLALQGYTADGNTAAALRASRLSLEG